MNKRNKLALIIAAGFFLFWLTVLYAGADHPPPPGFILVVLYGLACSVVVFLRTRTYIDWISAQKKKRLLRVFADGLAAGLVMALIAILASGSGEPSNPDPGIVEYIIKFWTCPFCCEVPAFNTIQVHQPGLLGICKQVIIGE